MQVLAGIGLSAITFGSVALGFWRFTPWVILALGIAGAILAAIQGPERLNGGARGTSWAIRQLLIGSMIAPALLYGLGRLASQLF